MKIARGGARSARGIFRVEKLFHVLTVTLPLIRLDSGKSCILKRTQLENTFKLYMKKAIFCAMPTGLVKMLSTKCFLLKQTEILQLQPPHISFSPERFLDNQ